MPSISAEQLEVLRPYLHLGEKLGSLQAQLLDGAPHELTVEYAGEVAALDVQAGHRRRAAGLAQPPARDQRGQLRQRAGELARERGIKVVESRSPSPKGFTNSITVRVRTAQKTSEVAGAIFGRDVIRLVQINDFFLEAVPEGFILMLNNRDVPGVVGAVGMLLGEAKINIAGLQLGRETHRRHGDLADPRRRAHPARTCSSGCARCPTSSSATMLEL